MISKECRATRQEIDELERDRATERTRCRSFVDVRAVPRLSD